MDGDTAQSSLRSRLGKKPTKGSRHTTASTRARSQQYDEVDPDADSFLVYKLPIHNLHTQSLTQTLFVKAPPMVGPTWMRVRFILGSDCLPALFQETILPLPLLFARACLMSDVRDLGVVLVRLICLVIMRVGARLHGTLYPITGCVLYLNRLLCWRCSLGLLMFPRLLYDSNTNNYCTWFAVL